MSKKHLLIVGAGHGTELMSQIVTRGKGGACTPRDRVAGCYGIESCAA